MQARLGDLTHWMKRHIEVREDR